MRPEASRIARTRRSRLRAGPLLLLVANLAAAGPAARAQEARKGDREAYITAQLANEVAVIDLSAGATLAHIPVDGAPAGIALSPNRRTAYVSRPEAPGLAVIDLDARKVTAMVPLPGGPLGICVNPRTSAVYVADWYAARVLVLEPAADGLKRTGEIAVGKSPSGLAVTPDGGTLLVANREADSVSVVDLSTGRETQRVPVGRHPFGLTLSADGARAYTANVLSNDVSAIDIAERREIGRVKTGERPYVIALAGNRGFVTDQYANSVSVFGLDDLKPVATIDVDDHPEGIAAAKDGKTVYVVNWGGNTLSVIDAATLKLTRSIVLPDGPRAFGDFIR